MHKQHQQTAHRPSVVTIDGPAASGKSTLGELLARHLGYTYFDTGVLYRALTLLALHNNVPLDDAPALVALAQHTPVDVQPPTVDDGRQYTVRAAGEDVTWAIRDATVDRSVSTVSAHPTVRDALREQQRAIGRRGQVVMVGRDIGSIVMPDADLKIFLLASPEERARRRAAELARKNQPIPYDTVLHDLQRRDALDRHNTFQPADAHVIHNEDRAPEAVLEDILQLLTHQARG